MSHVRTSSIAAACLVVPGALAGLGYHIALGHRTDYLGHFAAGYGATLGALIFLGLLLATPRLPSVNATVALAGVLACIAGGAVLEETIFNLAQFDLVDFCNQSLGAILAGLAVLMQPREERRLQSVAALGTVVALVFVYVGFRFSFASSAC